ncbi:2-methylisocitrate lyase-like PEP mutase family enzyme [Variovorax boronicumulans]|uniref:2-methylisocitrate lyase-like PEP mutase family enzyme n=1 Tax=Variovorax boronicumulans TaxID=436515 RepID=A0AAW8CTW4_9BURK|nr:isocitrate lyase/phosphoenolpyruvate mutase family protein [Variovorax boronicumulans]MDP9892050.1 2-methylisocitrate lyase-like PEP mutase family enzyme [Variovorax boronicumulans]MDQ0055135.1 2-methylisocitrate lyase-like PEP mutase family enzyme [Variovorax boronicumulans]
MPSIETRQQQMETFHRLHAGTDPLVLVNAWDAVSARIVERAGAKAMATTSAGIAWALGYADGERVPLDELLAATARICRVSRVPVTVDIERGFGDSTEAVCDLVRAFIDMGVAGINIEDGTLPGTRALAPPEILCERIEALRKLDARLFINARTDTYFVANDDPAARYADTLRRARLYAAAGADGIFVPGMSKLEEIAGLAAAVPLPVNVYAGHTQAPPVAVLAGAGARRISLGCGPLQAALGLLGRIAAEAFDGSDAGFRAMSAGMLSAGEINALFSGTS